MLLPSDAVTPPSVTTRLPFAVLICVTPSSGSMMYAVPSGPVSTYEPPATLAGLYAAPVTLS